MNTKRNSDRYCIELIYQFGYKVVNITLDDLDQIRTIILRSHETERKYNNHNWEYTFASIDKMRLRNTPVLDKLLQNLEVEGKIIRNIDDFFSLWPSSYGSAVLMTHDIDHVVTNSVREYVRRIPYSLRDLKSFAINTFSILKNLTRFFLNRKSDDWAALSMWANTERKNSINGTYYFLSQPVVSPHFEDSFYRYRDKYKDSQGSNIKDSILSLAQSGHEIGLHGSTGTSDSADFMQLELSNFHKRTGIEVVSNRYHHLCFDSNLSVNVLDKTGIKVDSTLGSNISTDYRCGTGMPHFLFNPLTDSVSDVLEVPLIIQDVALFKQMQLNDREALSLCLELISETKGSMTCLTLLWHNNYSINSPYFSVFKDVCEYLGSDNSIWKPTMTEMRNWIVKKNMIIEQNYGKEIQEVLKKIY